jgi:uncharacterized protein (DUF305 family)
VNRKIELSSLEGTGRKILLGRILILAFVQVFSHYHQGAIDMAKAELNYGHNEPLRGLAQEIIATQQQEIGAMQRALRE